MAEEQPERLLLAFAEERLSPSFSLSALRQDKSRLSEQKQGVKAWWGWAVRSLPACHWATGLQCSILHSPRQALQRRRCSRGKPCYHSTFFSSLDKPCCAYIKGKQIRPLALVVLFHLSEHAQFPGVRRWCDSTQGHAGTKQGLYQPHWSSASRLWTNAVSSVAPGSAAPRRCLPSR